MRRDMSINPALLAPPRQVIRAARRGGVVPLVAVVVGDLPDEVDLILYQGDDQYLDIAVTAADGTPANLAGMRPMSQIRLTPESTDVICAWVGVIILPNTVELHLTHAEAAKLIPGGSAWDVQVTDASGRVTTLAFGSVTTQAEVTR